MERCQLRNVFKVIGTNEDWVNASELREGLQNLQIHLSDEKFDRLVSLIDTNDNGRIEFIEFEELIFGSTQAEVASLYSVTSIYFTQFASNASRRRLLDCAIPLPFVSLPVSLMFSHSPLHNSHSMCMMNCM
jgi:hypothetical protein